LRSLSQKSHWGTQRANGHIPLLCVLFKILQRFIYARVDPIIDPLLPQEQAGFRHGRSAVDQVTLLTQDSFSAKKKTRAVFVDLTAAYDTAWHRGLICKLLRLLSHRHMIDMIMELVANRSFALTTGNGKRSMLRRLKNGVPQGSVLAPRLFNIHIADLPTTISRKYAYADDLAIMHADGDWQEVEGVLCKDMANVGEYLQTFLERVEYLQSFLAYFMRTFKYCVV